MKAAEITDLQKQETKAVSTGKKDAFLVGLFALGSTFGVQLLEWLLSGGLDLLDSVFKASWWPAVKGVLIIVLTMIWKGIDRKKHEDPSASTGLVKL